MLLFNEDRLVFLLKKLKAEFDKNVDACKYGIKDTGNSDDYYIVIEGSYYTDPPASSIAAHFIYADDPRIIEEVEVTDRVMLIDGVLSEENFTKPEKDLLTDLIEKGGLVEYLKQRLDCDKIEVLTKDEYDSNNSLSESVLYIVNDGPTVELLLDEYAKKEDTIKLEEDKLDKLVLDVVSGNSLTIVDESVKPSNNEIASNDPRIKDLIDDGTFNIGDSIDIKYGQLTEEDFTEEFNMILEYFRTFDNIDSLLTKTDVADNLDTVEIFENGDDITLANQGRILKEDYLSNKKYKYINMADFSEDIDNDETNYQVNNAPILYGLTAQQVEMLKDAYINTFTNYDELYAKKEDLSGTKVNSQGQSFASLEERLYNIDEKLNILLTFYNINRN